MFKIHLKKQKTVLYSIFKKPLSYIKSVISSCGYSDKVVYKYATEIHFMKLLSHFMKVIARSENLLYLGAKIWLQKLST